MNIKRKKFNVVLKGAGSPDRFFKKYLESSRPELKDAAGFCFGSEKENLQKH
jgi:hypothetical protein